MKYGNVLVMKLKGRRIIDNTYLLYCCPMYRRGMFLDNTMEKKYLVGLFHWGMIKLDDGTQN